MAFRNAAVKISAPNTLTPIYTVPLAKEAVVHALYIGNTNALLPALDVRVDVTVDINGTIFSIIKGAVIKPGTSLVFDKPINLVAGNILKIASDLTDSVEVFASILLENAS